MSSNMPKLSPAERATLNLRGLYEQYGYNKYKISQFEEYGLYVRFSNFITSGRILSFTDLDGRLLALKPDVTLSIAKNAQPEGGCVKAYYQENVYRENLSSGTMKEIAQMGLEYIGGDGSYAQTEVLALAYETLKAIGPRFVLEISHMGFITGLFESLRLEGKAAKNVLSALSEKSPHGIEAAAKEAGIGAVGIQVLSQLCSLSGSFTETLEKARNLCLNSRMTQALDDLQRTVAAIGSPKDLRLDFTLQGDMEYYDSLLISGYIEGVPRPVLSGGRYDGLIKKLGRDHSAVGFALYLDELSRIEDEDAVDNNDILLLAPEGTDPSALLKTVRSMIGEGKRVRVIRKLPDKPTKAALVRYEEVAPC